MAKSVKIGVDPSRGSVWVDDGALFLGEQASIVFDGYTPATGNSLYIALFADDRFTPLADNSSNAAVLDLRYEVMRKAFDDNKYAKQFYAVVNEKNSQGVFLQTIHAAGMIEVKWSPEVFSSVTGAPATLKGDKGDAGANGTNGTNGRDGADGRDGRDGTNGTQGVKGDNGFSPTVSTSSITGGTRVTITDAQGAHAFDVMNGAKGDTGATGAAGAKGDQGEKGDKGDKGDQGIQGIEGAKGDKGDKGDRGEGFPKGGTAGQWLSKKTDADYDYEWKSGSGVTDADAVHYSADSNKSAAEKAQARANIGAVAVPSTDTAEENGKFLKKTADGNVWDNVPAGVTLDTSFPAQEPATDTGHGATLKAIWTWVKSLLPSWLTSNYAEPATVTSVNGKADKVSSATSGNFAGLDANGNLVDSGKTGASFVQTSGQSSQSVEGQLSVGSLYVGGTKVVVVSSSSEIPTPPIADTLYFVTGS